MYNVHERHIAAAPERVGALLADIGGPADRLWPRDAWMPMRLDRPPGVGSRGGHADIRYAVTAYQPGRRLEFTFEPPTQLVGTHLFEVVDLGDGTGLLRHVLEARPTGSMRLLLPLVVRWVHDAVVEDCLDRAQAAVGAGPERPYRYTPWVRLLRRIARMPATVRPLATPSALLTAAALPRPDFSDAFAVRVSPGQPRDVAAWHAALLAAGTPPWLDALIRVRQLLARALRLETAQWQADAPFPALQSTRDLVVFGADDRHLDFRGVLSAQEDAHGAAEIVLATVVQRHNLVGLAYFALVRPVHRMIVPALLRRAADRVGHAEQPVAA